jgi:transposase-like protein
MNLQNPIYTDKNKAREHLEALRWPDGPVCPHCGVVDNAVALNGKSTRPGVYKCRDCHKPFSVTVGTVFERSKIPLNKWLLANHMLASGKKGTSSHQIHRTLGVTYKTAWFMTHRIREAMTPAKDAGPLGGPGKSVEADETFLAKSPKTRKTTPLHAKPDRVVLSLVERGGSLRSVYLDGKTVRQFLMPKVLHDDSRLLTDGAQHYKFQYRLHESVDHSKLEWTRGDVHTNTLENFFSIFKRGLTGVYQHCSSAHLHRYLAEFDFRYNNRSKLGIEDAERANNALKGIGGKRLTYRRPDETTPH